ncbi:ABA4-like family protein [Salegentibacter sp. Hel_I_6]|uniref:ABA4-like family protein n=1 Tax=Salegentibacter sp. Hel_I_6 TaxID=1250278 RepID=UPI000563241F|nr:ABA4-like family protein [Salegentibacter sp. Hel_I_6]
MTPIEVFSMANAIVLPMWFLMIFLPQWKITRFLIAHRVIPIILAVLYTVYILLYTMDYGIMDFSSLSSVMTIFTQENAVLAGWLHYLAFDLLVGIWILNQNKFLGLNQLLIAPCLFLTFMFGPLGFLIFIVIKATKNNKR